MRADRRRGSRRASTRTGDSHADDSRADDTHASASHADDSRANGSRPGGAAGPVLQLSGVSRVHGDGSTQVRALYQASLTVEAGEMVAVMGPSGAGKSTLLALAGALDLATEGSVVIEGHRTDNQDANALAAVRRRGGATSATCSKISTCSRR